MFSVDCYKIPVFRYNDYQFFFRGKNRKKFKTAVAPNPTLALGLLLVMNREEISEPGSELRKLLDAAAELDIPGLNAIADGIWSRREWAKKLLPESSWSFPEEFMVKLAPSEDSFIMNNSLDTLIAESDRRKDEGRKMKDKDDRKSRKALAHWKRLGFQV